MPHLDIHDQVSEEAVVLHAPLRSVAVHPQLGKVEVFAVDGDLREVRIPAGNGYRHIVVHVETLSIPPIDDVLGINTNEDRILTRLLIGQTVEA